MTYRFPFITTNNRSVSQFAAVLTVRKRKEQNGYGWIMERFGVAYEKGIHLLLHRCDS